MATTPVFVDVDTGLDDALALALLTRTPDVSIVGVGTVAGNVPIGFSTENTLRVLSWCGAERVPVYRGASRPLVAPYQDAAHVHGGDGLGGAMLPPSARNIADVSAPEALFRAAREYTGQLVLVTLGPLTNIAMALDLFPELTDHVRRVSVMGGAYDVPGNITPAAEFNIYVDPDAANQVFAAPWREIVAIGLDVTHQTILPREDWELSEHADQPTAQLERRLLTRTFSEREKTGFFLHDPLAAAVALDRSIVTTEPRTVSVVPDGDERGRTNSVPGGNVDVATTVAAARFVYRFEQRLGLPHAEGAGAAERPE
jgi:inosine-uridine nucleoside N-ribohydrolase